MIFSLAKGYRDLLVWKELGESRTTKKSRFAGQTRRERCRGEFNLALIAGQTTLKYQKGEGPPRGQI